jgi:hypothetical protein
VLTGVAACWVLPEIWRYVSSSAGAQSRPAHEVSGGAAPGPDLPEPDLPEPDLPEPDRPGLPG